MELVEGLLRVRAPEMVAAPCKVEVAVTEMVPETWRLEVGVMLPTPTLPPLSFRTSSVVMEVESRVRVA